MTARLAKPLPAVIGLSVSLFLAFYPVVLSGGELVPGDMNDARLVNYFLEHGYRWVKQESLHQDLWNMPFFYPEPNTGAYSDILLSAGPFYWCWRIAGCSPESAFQLWFVAIVTLNYLSMYLFLSRCCRLSGLPSAFGAFFFTSASPRLLHIGHPQLHVQFFTMICCYALYRIFELGSAAPAAPKDPAEKPIGGRSRLSARTWIVVFTVALVGQLYASFYLGWFLGLGLAVMTGWALFLPRPRRHLLTVFRKYRGTWLLCGLLAVSLLADMARHYVAAVRRTGWRDPAEMLSFVPDPGDWSSRGNETFVNARGILRHVGIDDADTKHVGEHALGVGPVTTLFVILGLVGLRRRLPGLLLLLSALTIFLLVTRWLPGLPSAWGIIYRWIPGAGALRAIGRVVLLLLVPAAIGLAFLIQERRRIAVAWLIVLLCGLEQAREVVGYSKARHREDVARVASQVSPGSRAFYYAPTTPPGMPLPPGKWTLGTKIQIDAMWAQLELGVPTLNGYSGKTPPGWSLFNLNPEAQPSLEKRLASWLAQNRLPKDSVCVIRSPLTEPPVIAETVTFQGVRLRP